MAKFLNRLAARLGREKLRESAKEGKNWIVTKKLILETDEGDMEFEKGDNVEIGSADGDLAMKGQAAVVVISDADLASKIADIVVSSDELSDVNFVEKPALDAVLDGEQVDDVIDSLADDDDENVEVAELDVDKKESVENKFAKFAENVMKPAKVLACESILIDESDNAPIAMSTIKTDRVVKESFDNYDSFAARVSELKGSLQPGKREIALAENGKVCGAYDKEANMGTIYPEETFEAVEDMDNFDSDPEALVQDVDFGDMAGDEDMIEACLKTYEESAKSGKDYMALVESLASAEKCGLKEAAVSKIVGTFDNKALQECVRVYDGRFGKYVHAFRESSEADNFIEETGEAKHFTKRFFN